MGREDFRVHTHCVIEILSCDASTNESLLFSLYS